MENTNIYQYGGFKSKPDREKLKDKLMKTSDESAKSEDNTAPENPDAGAALVTAKQSSFSKFWSNLKENNPLTASKLFFLFFN